MTENSKIEWTDHTFNPWTGCTKVSDGCKNCYAESLMDKRWGKVEWGPRGERKRTSEANWKKPYTWNRKAQSAGIRYKVFCASLADVFEDKPDQRLEMDQWRSELFQMIHDTPNLDWLLLTKRPENVAGMCMSLLPAAYQFVDPHGYMLPNNVWIGTSVENQEQADTRIPELLKIPAAVRFLSMEPLLGPVSLPTITDEGLDMDENERREWGLPKTYITDGSVPGHFIDWVIVGGESGHNARPMHPDWVDGIREQCAVSSVPFFFKQWGEWAPNYEIDHDPNLQAMALLGRVKDHQFATGSSGRSISYRFGKSNAGRSLDGRLWNETPAKP